MTDDELDILTTEEVAAILRVEASTVTSWRFRDTGPKWIKIGRAVRYHRADLDAYIAEARGLRNE